MKRIAFLFTIITIIQSVSAVTVHAQGLNDPFDEDRVRAARNEFERERSCDPSTGKIPENMGALELEFARRHASTRSALKGQTILANDWSWRGPSNISGRTLAIGIDVSNPQVMLAGSTSGGVYRSTNERRASLAASNTACGDALGNMYRSG
jgi:hypothetical protein